MNFSSNTGLILQIIAILIFFIGIFISIWNHRPTVFSYLNELKNYVNERITQKNIKLILNITEMEKIEPGTHFEDFKLLFGTWKGEGLLVVAQTGDDNLNKLFGLVATPSDLIPCKKCKEYSFSLRNIGEASATNVVIDLLSDSDLNILDHEKDPKIGSVNCGGILDNKGCRIEIERIDEKETIFFTGITKGSGVRKVICEIEGREENCHLNFRHYYLQKITEDLVFRMDDKEITFPAINYGNEFVQYYYNSKSDSWIQTKINN